MCFSICLICVFILNPFLAIFYLHLDMSSIYWPFAILLLAILIVVIFITRLKMHPFIALMLTAIMVGLLSAQLPGAEGQHHWIRAVELPMKEFGATAGKIAWVIGLAAMIGMAMMESGAAQRIVRSLLAAFGESRAAWALLISGFVLSIPVFFDTVFFLLIPLAVALAVKTGKNFVLYVIAICGGAVITHSLVAPTPGPLIMAETLGIDLGLTIIAGILAGIIPSIIALWIGKRQNDRLNIPVRVSLGDSAELMSTPSLFMSVLPIALPVVLIGMVSVIGVLGDEVPSIIQFLGNKNIAMALGTMIALWSWKSVRGLSYEELWRACGQPLEIAGIIILITSAGGAFGAMIKHSGIGAAIEAATSHVQIHYILLAWLISAVMKTAQGSTTVAVITASSIMVALMGSGAELGYHPIYIYLAIGFGGGFISWMNDSGFWVVSKMSGFTEKEALQTWTLMFACISVIGLIEVLLCSFIFPFN